MARRLFPFAVSIVLGCGATSSPDPSPVIDACATCRDSGTDARFDAGADTSSAVDASDATDVDDVAIPTSRLPPKRPTATATGTTKWFAFRRLQLGLTRRADGTADTAAWEDYGYDLDGRITTLAASEDGTNHCKRHPDSKGPDVIVDGAGGTDNNFGHRVAPLIKAIGSDPEAYGDASIRDGKWTLLLKLENVGPADNAKVPGTLYVAHAFNDGFGTPVFDETDHWTIAAESVTDGKDIEKPRVKFADGYMAGGVWVSGDLGKTTIPVPLVMLGVFTIFPLESGIITVRVEGGTEGTIAGGTSTKELLEAFDPILRSFGVCPGSGSYDAASTAVTRSADLVSRAPSLQDPTKTCDAISSGLGFTMAPTGVPTKVLAIPPGPPDPCGGP